MWMKALRRGGGGRFRPKPENEQDDDDRRDRQIDNGPTFCKKAYGLFPCHKGPPVHLGLAVSGIAQPKCFWSRHISEMRAALWRRSVGMIHLVLNGQPYPLSSSICAVRQLISELCRRAYLPCIPSWSIRMAKRHRYEMCFIHVISYYAITLQKNGKYVQILGRLTALEWSQAYHTLCQ